MNIHEYVENLCISAKKASVPLAVSDGETRAKALMLMAQALEEAKDEITEANKADLRAAELAGVSGPMLDRLMLNDSRIADIASSLRDVAALPDPLGTDAEFTRPNGLVIRRMRVPFGVIAMIYEARPNVTPDAAALCIRSGNAAVLRGGKEAICTNRVLVRLLQEALVRAGLPAGCIAFIDDPTREGTNALFEMKDYVDLLIPRGSRGLIRACLENSKIPTIETGAGNCHLYVDESADTEMAVNVAMNAKTSRPSVCNAIETLLVHEKEAAAFLPVFAQKASAAGVELRCCPGAMKYVPGAVPADESDWDTEYDDLILAVRVVKNIDAAMEHIAKYGTRHSECIITRDDGRARRFQKEVDAAAVYVNASTRFTDGGEFGFGAEIGISTQKMHARGPMALREITTVKYEIDGNGQTR